jgi:uncharacterized membrane protein
MHKNTSIIMTWAIAAILTTSVLALASPYQAFAQFHSEGANTGAYGAIGGGSFAGVSHGPNSMSGGGKPDGIQGDARPDGTIGPTHHPRIHHHHNKGGY